MKAAETGHRDLSPPPLSTDDRSGPCGADEEKCLALCLAPEEGTDGGTLLRLTGMEPPDP
jgi:hypothetical protein